MKIFFYWKPEHSEGERFQQKVESLIPADEKVICHSIEDLTERRRQHFNGEIIAVFLIADQNDLSDILSIHNVLRDIRLILILPDHERTTISKGHKLYPRFVSYIDSDFSDVTAVLDKMIHGSFKKKLRKESDKTLKRYLRNFCKLFF